MFTPIQRNLIHTIIQEFGTAGTDADWGRYFQLPNEQFDSLFLLVEELGERFNIPFVQIGEYSVRRTDPFPDLLEKIWYFKIATGERCD